MRDHAFHQVSLGYGVETMATPLAFKPGSFIKGTQISHMEVPMSFEEFKGRFVPTSAVATAIEAASRLFTRLSPHSQDNCIPAISIESLEGIQICWIQVDPPQKDAAHTGLEEAAAEDVDRTKRTADHVRELFDESQRGQSGEAFIKALHQSPDINLAREMLRRSNSGGVDVTSTRGSLLTKNGGKAVVELPCAEVQTVRIKVGVSNEKQVCVTIVDPMSHADFWQYFPDKTVFMEVVDTKDQKSLLCCRMIDEILTVEINVTVLSPHGRRTREGVQASLSQSLDHRALARKLVDRLCSQYELDFSRGQD